MCWCRPEIRTPNCGRIGCHPPSDATLREENARLKKLEYDWTLRHEKLWIKYNALKQQLEKARKTLKHALDFIETPGYATAAAHFIETRNALTKTLKDLEGGEKERRDG